MTEESKQGEEASGPDGSFVIVIVLLLIAVVGIFGMISVSHQEDRLDRMNLVPHVVCKNLRPGYYTLLSASEVNLGQFRAISGTSCNLEYSDGTYSQDRAQSSITLHTSNGDIRVQSGSYIYSTKPFRTV